MEILLGEKFIYILDGTLKKVAEIKYLDAFFINELKFFDENMYIKIKNFIEKEKLFPQLNFENNSIKMFYNKSSSEFGYFYHFLKDVIYLIKKDQK
jgi:hypothetical protein